ncbi:TniQ family protein [Paraburkholderia tropica]|uniref:TniQ family protein n=1 Tax=Paraburkholderia tropica TaxID=92647 RepID=UPI0015916E1D|nr:TniQ family protein [Paraburkholderia tropica]
MDSRRVITRGELFDASAHARIEVQGEGTGRIEQLSSVAARLAEKLCLPFIEVYRFAINQSPSAEGAVGRLPMISRKLLIEAIGETALKWTTSLARFTGAADLRNCTLLPFQGAIAAKRLVSPGRRWCPVCLEEMADSGIVYEPLVWRVSETLDCARHRRPLVDICPDCGKGTQSSLVANARVGCCRYCGSWLGRKAVSTEAPSQSLFALYCAQACEDLLALPQCVKDGESILPSSVSVSGLRDCFFEGNGSAMARRLGELPSQLNAYCNGEFPAPLHVFLRAGYVTGASMHQILVSQDFSVLGAGNAEAQFDLRRAEPRAYDQSHVDESLRAAILDGGGMSVLQLASQLNVEVVTLWRRSPKLAKELAIAHAAYIAKRSAKGQSEFVESVRTTVADLRSQGVNPTASEVKRLLGDAGIGLNPWKRTVVHELTGDVGPLERINRCEHHSGEDDGEQ